jgi:hypothetical protein
MMVDVIRLHPETLLSSLSKIGGFMTFFSAFSGIIFFAINSFDWKKKVKAHTRIAGGNSRKMA